MDYYSHTLFALLAALYCWQGATAAPSRRSRATTTLRVTTPRWHEPCAGKRRAGSTPDLSGILSSIATPEFNATGDYRLIQEHALVSKENTIKLMNNITVKRIKYDIERDTRDLRLDGLPIIPGSVNMTQNVAALLQQTYEWLMRFAVFLEAMGIDEAIEKRTHVVNFHKEVRELEDNFVYWLLCKLESTMEGHGIAPAVRLDRDIVGTYHTSHRAVRHLRGFLILRDLRDAFTYIEGAFDIILEQSLSSEESSSYRL